MSLTRPIIIGLDGLELTASERQWLPDLMPYGVILFSRNIDSPDQVRALTASIRACLGDDVAILVDQEGGRVQRLKPPHWPTLPSPLSIGRVWRRHQFKGLALANALGQIIGSNLAEVGITHTCAPVVDLLYAGADPVIGDRAFGETPAEVIPLASAFLDGLSRTGVVGILKHLPGMGRATVDSHLALPRIETPVQTLLETDALPFRKISGTRWMMSAHVSIPEWDEQPVTTSNPAIEALRQWIPDAWILSDCLTMGALTGSASQRVEDALNAGIDLALFSNGDDRTRRDAVSSAGVARVAREPRNALSPLDPATKRLYQGRLNDLGASMEQADPTWDQPTEAQDADQS